MLSKVRGGLIAGIAWCASTVAADAGWYVGVSGVAGRFAADYDKAVINSAPSPRAGQTFRDGDADESWKIGYGALAG